MKDKNNAKKIIVVMLILVIILSIVAVMLVMKPRKRTSTVVKETSNQVVQGDVTGAEITEEGTNELTSAETTSAKESGVVTDTKTDAAVDATTKAAKQTEEATKNTEDSTKVTEKETTADSTGETTAETTQETTKETTVNSSKDKNSKTVVIDAGHQARGNSSQEPIGPGASQKKDKVASGAEGEYQINLDVSLKLRDELESRGYKVVMIRETNDVNISNSERAEIANKTGGIFIRIHCNDDNSSSPKGALTMCGTASNPYCPQIYKASRKLSESVLNGLCNATGARNRGVMETDTMSGINWCTVPVTIVEMGFLSNGEENKLLHSDAYQDKLAKGIADGIDNYY